MAGKASIIVKMHVLLLGFMLAGPPVPQPVELLRTFKKGERAAYRVQSELSVERRGGTLQTFLPSDLTILYDFSLEVQSLGADGIAKVRYLRPTLTEIEGETFDEPPKKKTEKLNQDILLTLSPVNEVLEYKDQPAKKPGKALIRTTATLTSRQEGLIEQYLGEVYRMALFIGPPDSSLDLAPKLPLDEVNVGDTWRKTVSYQPQTLKGSDGKKAVQRLDYVYTYKGPATWNGKPVLRIEGAVDLDTDLGAYINQLLKGAGVDESPIKTMPLKVKGRISFDLDPKTKKTLRATATTEGDFKVFLTESPDQAIEEERFKGTTTLREVPVKP